MTQDRFDCTDGSQQSTNTLGGLCREFDTHLLNLRL